MEQRLLMFLQELGQEMREQEVDGQAHPRFWVIADYRKEPRPEGWHSDYLLCLPNCDLYDCIVDEFIKDAKENAEDRDIKITKEFLDDIDNIECEIGALEFAQKHFDEDAYLIPFEEEMFLVPNTFFIAKKDAKDYLQKYGYNHGPKAHTYAMTALRSPMFHKLIDMIMELESPKKFICTMCKREQTVTKQHTDDGKIVCVNCGTIYFVGETVLEPTTPHVITIPKTPYQKGVNNE